MERLQKLKIIFEKELVRTLEDHELNNTWEELDLDSLSMISVLRDVEDEFKIVLEYNIFKDHKINCINNLDAYLNKTI